MRHLLLLLSSGCAPVPASAPPPPEDCIATVDVPLPAPRQGASPRCLTAAMALTLSAPARLPVGEGHPSGSAPTERALAREVRVTPEGVDPFDLQETLRRMGWESLVFTGPPEAAARLVEAGFAPVAIVDLGGGRKHAVAVVGAERVPVSGGSCSTALAALHTVDPREGTPRRETAQAFAARQWAQQLIVAYRPGERARLDAARFPVAAAVAVDARFRAEALLQRAAAHATPNAQSVRLLEQATAADPAWAPAREALERHRAALAP